jgi:hypothetical protein
MSRKFADEVASSYAAEPEPTRFGVIAALTRAAQKLEPPRESMWDGSWERYSKLSRQALVLAFSFNNTRQKLLCFRWRRPGTP